MSDVHNITDEILMMRQFDHPNVMTLIGVCVSVGGGPAIVMPFMENGSLLNYLRRDKKNITVKDDEDLETVSCTITSTPFQLGNPHRISFLIDVAILLPLPEIGPLLVNLKLQWSPESVGFTWSLQLLFTNAKSVHWNVIM